MSNRGNYLQRCFVALWKYCFFRISSIVFQQYHVKLKLRSCRDYSITWKIIFLRNVREHKLQSQIQSILILIAWCLGVLLVTCFWCLCKWIFDIKHALLKFEVIVDGISCIHLMIGCIAVGVESPFVLRISLYEVQLASHFIEISVRSLSWHVQFSYAQDVWSDMLHSTKQKFRCDQAMSIDGLLARLSLRHLPSSFQFLMKSLPQGMFATMLSFVTNVIAKYFSHVQINTATMVLSFGPAHQEYNCSIIISNVLLSLWGQRAQGPKNMSAHSELASAWPDHCSGSCASVVFELTELDHLEDSVDNSQPNLLSASFSDVSIDLDYTADRTHTHSDTVTDTVTDTGACDWPRKPWAAQATANNSERLHCEEEQRQSQLKQKEKKKMRRRRHVGEATQSDSDCSSSSALHTRPPDLPCEDDDNDHNFPRGDDGSMLRERPEQQQQQCCDVAPCSLCVRHLTLRLQLSRTLHLLTMLRSQRVSERVRGIVRESLHGAESTGPPETASKQDHVTPNDHTVSKRLWMKMSDARVDVMTLQVTVVVRDTGPSPPTVTTAVSSSSRGFCSCVASSEVTVLASGLRRPVKGENSSDHTIGTLGSIEICLEEF